MQYYFGLRNNILTKMIPLKIVYQEFQIKLVIVYNLQFIKEFINIYMFPVLG